MKTILRNVLAIVMVTIASVSQAQVKVIEFGQLPSAAQKFVAKYYDASDVSYVSVESEFMSSKEYEVRMNDGKKIEFDAKGQWKDIDGKKKAVPADVIPQAIQAHVKRSFPNNQVVQISRSARKYEVELSNGLDLEFDKKGKFVRIDD